MAQELCALTPLGAAAVNCHVLDICSAMQKSTVRSHVVQLSGDLNKPDILAFNGGVLERSQPLHPPADTEFVLLAVDVQLVHIAQVVIFQLRAAGPAPVIAVVSCQPDLDPRILLAAVQTLRQANVADVIVQPNMVEDLSVEITLSIHRVTEDYAHATSHTKAVQAIQMKTNNLFWPHVHKIFPGFPKMEPGMLPTPAPGSSVGSYHFSELLGSGSCSQVFRARDSRNGQDVAMKVVVKDKVQDCRQVRNLWNEWYWLKKLQHTNIVGMHDWIHTQGHVHMCLDFGGATLGQMLREQGRLSPTVVQPLWRQLTSALAYCHESGVAHRDVRPEKVAVHGERAMLMGFGRAVDSQRRHQDPCGVTPFMAPEVLLEDTYDAGVADVWSLGMVLVEMTCGGLCRWECSTPTQEQALQLRTAFSDLSTVKSDMERIVSGEDLEDIMNVVSGVLNTVPSERNTAKTTLKSAWLAQRQEEEDWVRTLRTSTCGLGGA